MSDPVLPPENDDLESKKPPIHDPLEIRKQIRSEQLTVKVMKELNLMNSLPKHLLEPLLVDRLHHSSSPFHTLKRIGIADLRTLFPAKGCYMLLRNLECPILHSGLKTIVEDHTGFIFTFIGYNFIDYNPLASAETFLPVGTVFVLKEPVLTVITDGQFNIRCDSPTDLVRVDRNHALYDEVRSIQWTHSIDTAPECEPTTNIDWRLRGNQFFREKKFSDSLESYLVALRESQSSDLTFTLHLNLAAVYLAMGNFESTLKHCTKVFETQPNNEKGLFRAGKALYNLRRIQEAKEHFKMILSKNAQQKETSDELKRCEERIDEQEGHINVYKLHLTSIIKPRTYMDTGDYVGPLKVVEVQGKGRGVIATEDIKPGTLLVISKAIAATFYDYNDKTSAYAYQLQGIHLIAEIGRIISKNPTTFGKSVYELYTNDPVLDSAFSVFCDEENCAEPIADLNRIRKIVQTNSFFLQHPKTLENVGTELFLFPSYFNHSCVKNASWATYNDIMIIHALKHIKSGEEITLTYGKSVSNYLTKTEKYQGLGFKCSCSLCKLDHSEPLAVHEEREAMDVESKVMMGPLFSIQRWKGLIQKMEQAYGERQMYRLRLFLPYIQIFNLECIQGKNIQLDYTKTLDKAMSCLGLTCDDLFRCANDPAESLPKDSLLLEDYLEQSTCMTVLRLDSLGLDVEVLKWLKVMVMLERIFTGGGVNMLIDLYRNRDELEVCALLKKAKLQGLI